MKCQHSLMKNDILKSSISPLMHDNKGGKMHVRALAWNIEHFY